MDTLNHKVTDEYCSRKWKYNDLGSKTTVCSIGKSQGHSSFGFPIFDIYLREVQNVSILI